MMGFMQSTIVVIIYFLLILQSMRLFLVGSLKSHLNPFAPGAKSALQPQATIGSFILQSSLLGFRFRPTIWL